MAVVDFNRSLAIRARRRQQVVFTRQWTLARWGTRVKGFVGLAILIPALLRLTTFDPRLIGGALFLLGTSLSFFILDLYVRTRWSALPELPPLKDAHSLAQSPNLADYLSLDGVVVIQEARGLSRSIGRDEFDGLLLCAGLVNSPSRFIAERAGISVTSSTAQTVVELARRRTPALGTAQTIMEWAAEEIIREGRERIDDGDLLLAAARTDQVFSQYLFDAHVTVDDLHRAVDWVRRFRGNLVVAPVYDRPVGMGIAREWTSGYTPYLNQFSVNLTAQAANTTIYGRDEEVNLVERWLAKDRGHNVLLVGRPGIGKEAIIYGTASRIGRGSSLPVIRYMEIHMLDLNVVLAGVSDRAEIEARLLRIFDDATHAGNIILYIPDIHLLIGGGERVGSVDATQLVLQALQAPNLRIIATTDPDEFQARIASNSSLAALFERLDVGEPSTDATLTILEDSVPAIEAQSQTYFSIDVLRTLVDIAERYVHDQPFPEKALRLLSEVAIFAQTKGIRVLSPDDVRGALSDKLKIPLETAQGDERDVLVHLENELHKTVIGQDEAITTIADAVRRARAGLASGKRPIASLLFLGPTGVGKTESAKALARVYFEDEKRMIRLDMSEYQQADGLVRLIGAAGASTGVKVGGYLADAVHDQPFSLILLDELEKAHPQILNLFLQVLDDGRLTDGMGRTIDFTNTIIIATSNAGAELIRQSIAAGESQELRRSHLLEYLQSSGIYKPEFLNRFDGVVAFHPLTPSHISVITRLLLADLTDRVRKEHDMNVQFSDDLVTILATRGFDPQFGARPLRRLLQDTVESWLSKELLSGALVRGSSVMVTAATVGLVPSPSVEPVAVPPQPASLEGPA